MAGPRGSKRKAIVQGAAQRATKKPAVATSAGSGASSLGAQQSAANVTSATITPSSNISPALQMGDTAASASKEMAEQSAARIAEDDSVDATSADQAITAPGGHLETTSEKTRLSQHAKLHIQPNTMASEPVAPQMQVVQTAAQRVLNLPELLEPILLSVTKQVKELKTILLAQRVNKTWRLTVQTSMPLKRALWLEHDEKAESRMAFAEEWNPSIWPNGPLSNVAPIDEKWLRTGSRFEQSWSKMIVTSSKGEDVHVRPAGSDLLCWKCRRIQDCRVSDVIGFVRAVSKGQCDREFEVLIW